jgi:hypothetical protein
MPWPRLTAVLALGLIGASSSLASPFDDHIFVVTSDMANGTGDSAAFDIERPWKSASGLEPTGPGVIVRHFFGRHYVVHRLTGQIQVIDPATFETTLQFSVGEGSNPHDIVVVNNHVAYVSRHASPWLYEVDPTTGDLITMIDLAGFADRDGIPEMSMMALDGHRLFIQLQRLDPDGQPTHPSYLAVLDVRTNQLIDVDPAQAGVQAIELTGLLPSFKMQIDDVARRLYVSEPGVFHDGSGGIDEIDLVNLTALRFITTEAQVALDISGFVLVSPEKGYVITHTDLTLSSHLQPFSRIDGSGLGPELTVSFSQVDYLVHDPITDQLFFPVPEDNGVLVFDATSQELLRNNPIDTGSRPADLVLARAVTPGEATGLRVESRDPETGDLALSYDAGCGAPDHTLVFGPLEEIGAYGYSGQICGIGNLGELEGFNPGPGSYFFLIVANDGNGTEGSYGLDSSQQERPEDTGDPVCGFVQDLSLRCD